MHLNQRVVLFICLLLLVFISFSSISCASRMIRDNSLVIEVIPQPIFRGKPGRVIINAPMDAKEVIGTVRVMGSPEFIFVRDKRKGVWTFYGTIPFSPWITPGKYTIRVVVKASGPGKDRYTEMDFVLQ